MTDLRSVLKTHVAEKISETKSIIARFNFFRYSSRNDTSPFIAKLELGTNLNILFHNFIVLSLEPLTINVPSGEKTTELTTS